jgi:gliding motility-associated-like protein
MKKVFTFLVLWLLLSRSVSAQLVVTSAFTPLQLVNSVLLGPGVVAFNIQYTGSSKALGFFNGVTSNIGLDSGVIISTGKVKDAIGPNNTTSITTINNTPGNAQLTQLAGQPTKDAAVLEFDFIPSADTVRFRYVFASDEYYEGVCTPYNDIFAFLINGPGITGTANIALVPGTSKPVSISSVNGGVLGDPIYGPNTSYTYCVLTNTVFYVDNTSSAGLSVQYDGFTKVFIAKSKVIPCQTYHIKLAIADGGNDNTWDSSVFLEAGSFNSHYLSVSNQPKYTGGFLDSSAVEGCGQAIITFKRYDSIPYPRAVNYTLSGTALPSDYIISAANIYFAPGKDTVNLSIKPVFDNIKEGIETLSLTLIPDFVVCNGWTIPGGSVKFIDDPPIDISISKNIPPCPYDSIGLKVNLLNALSSNSYSLSWSSNSGNTYYSNPISVFPTKNLIYTANVIDNCGQKNSISVSLNYDCPFIIPNIITPNGDNVNDKFIIRGLERIGAINLYVFNRWGTLIYEMKNYDNSWSPINTEDGVYFYVIENSGAQKHKGHLTILK